MSTNRSTHFTIGALAKQAEVAIDTIRYYEREQLLPPPVRRPSGYREYDAQAVGRVRFIRRAKDLGFSLQEIRDLLALESDRDHGVQGIKQRASKRLEELNQRIAEMIEIRDLLSRLVEACPGEGAPECCPILSSMRAPESAQVPATPQPNSCCGSGDAEAEAGAGTEARK